ncbi:MULTISPECIES: hypothetical protein [Mycolicibacterium]|uniref:hypothetical protein n=1 Tax=Mycolicibacterium TaxID=1866885 RepID=UPI001401C392|nr:hypothetical protein [Mycolicibacterium austroafricanum]
MAERFGDHRRQRIKQRNGVRAAFDRQPLTRLTREGSQRGDVLAPGRGPGWVLAKMEMLGSDRIDCSTVTMSVVTGTRWSVSVMPNAVATADVSPMRWGADGVMVTAGPVWKGLNAA